MTAARFEFDDLSQRGFCFLYIIGELTDDEARDEFLLHAGLMLASEESKLVVHLSGVDYVRSSFLAEFVDLHLQAAERRKLVTFYVPAWLGRRLHRIGLDQVLRIVTVPRRESGVVAS
jgi:anti-anti-sigma regulatory factor